MARLFSGKNLEKCDLNEIEQKLPSQTYTNPSFIFLINLTNQEPSNLDKIIILSSLFHFESIWRHVSLSFRHFFFSFASSSSKINITQAISSRHTIVPCDSFGKRSSGGKNVKRCAVFEERENRREGKYPPRCPRVELRFHGGLNSSRELPLNEDLEVGGASRIRN